MGEGVNEWGRWEGRSMTCIVAPGSAAALVRLTPTLLPRPCRGGHGVSPLPSSSSLLLLPFEELGREGPALACGLLLGLWGGWTMRGPEGVERAGERAPCAWRKGAAVPRPIRALTRVRIRPRRSIAQQGCPRRCRRGAAGARTGPGSLTPPCGRPA